MPETDRELGARRAPTISVILPVHDPVLRDLARAVASARAQRPRPHEICVVDDGSSDPEVVAFLDALAARRDVRFVRRPEVGGIAAATNAALDLASGDFVLFLDHDDELADGAMREVVRALRSHPDADVLYTDHDVVDEQGRRIGLDRKPGWSPELLLAYMYLGHAKVMRTSLVRDVGGMRAGFEGSSDHDLMLRIAERTDRVHHLPAILYHWRAARDSMAAHAERKAHAFDSGRRAVQEAAERRGLATRALRPGWAQRAGIGAYQLDFEPRAEERVTALLRLRSSGAALRRCVESIEWRTRYPSLAVAVFDPSRLASDEDATWLAERGVALLPVSGSEASTLSQVVAGLDGDYVVLLDDDLLVVEPRWLSALVGFGRADGVGLVGAKVVGVEGTIRHAGLLLGVRGGVESAFRGRPDSHSPLEHGYYAHVCRDCAAVSASCLLARRETLLCLGIDDDLGALALGTDLSLRARARGLRVVCCPFAELLATGDASSEALAAAERDRLRARWGARLLEDPYYNPGFDRLDSSFTPRTTPLERVHARLSGRVRALRRAALDSASARRVEARLRHSRFRPALGRILRRIRVID